MTAAPTPIAPLPLHWFPVFVSDWLTSEAITVMEPEQEGAYFRLLLVAWGDGSAPPSLPTDDAALAKLSRLGSRWRKLGQMVRAQFVEQGGRLINSKLTEVWYEQQRKHETAVARGSKGGRTRAAKLKLGASSTSSSASSSATDQAKQSESEGAVEPPSGALPAPAPSGARALEGAALAGANDDAPTKTPRAEQDDELKARDEAYYAQLEYAANLWLDAHPILAREIGDEKRRELGFPERERGQLHTARIPVLRSAVVNAIRLREGWPSVREWDGVTPFGADAGVPAGASP